ncbi:MAG TPA: ribose-phosphate diphosphokinase, partial [Blastocatellia bacterium]|nr:ribose-phosphate diphosphokinase [Blastocatellia bacterium]
AVPTLADRLRGRIPPDAVVVSPDAGRVRMATEYAHRLGTSVVVLHKQRESGAETRITHIVGDVRDKACLIIDDMISTGGTIAESIEALLGAGARPELTIAATHCLFLEAARDRLSHEAIREIFVTDTVSPKGEAWPRLKIVSIAPLIAGAISRFVIDGSLSDLY